MAGLLLRRSSAAATSVARAVLLCRYCRTEPIGPSDAAIQQTVGSLSRWPTFDSDVER
jgi:hypothetical protein